MLIQNRILLALLKDNVDELVQIQFAEPEAVHFIMDTVDKKPEYTIHTAARVGATKCLKFILDCAEDPNELGGKANMAPLHLAAKYGQYDALCVLLNHKDIDVNVESDLLRTPLLEAVSGNFSEDLKIKIVTKLLEHGANPTMDGEFRKGLYGTPEYAYGLFESRNVFLTAEVIAQHNGEEKLCKILNEATQEWNKKHPPEGCLKLLFSLGLLFFPVPDKITGRFILNPPKRKERVNQ